MLHVFDVFHNRKREAGEVGLEIEVEGADLPQTITGWRSEVDASLRGESLEYVLREPVSREQVPICLKKITKAYARCGSRIANSYRCSTHVHINVQELTMKEVYSFILLYAMFEPFLVKYCGEHREGNLFCLRIGDAEGIVPALRLAATTGEFNQLGSPLLRYGALNVTALAKYGSLEFRAMRGTEDMAAIGTWVKLLLALKDAAVAYKNPVTIIEDISGRGARGLAYHVFGGLLKEVPLPEEWEDTLFNSMRDLQDIAYCGEG